ncbi:MAG: DUF983 domain-containing protein [Bacteroidota bacterium]
MLAKLNSIFNHKCPRCLEGDIYSTKSSYDLKNISKMNHSCQQCGLDFEREPGYYYGAMYVSYALTVALAVSLFVAYIVLFPTFDSVVYLVALTTMLLVLAPWTFRTSRVIWLNFFIKFKPEIQKEVRTKKAA